MVPVQMIKCDGSDPSQSRHTEKANCSFIYSGVWKWFSRMYCVLVWFCIMSQNAREGRSEGTIESSWGCIVTCSPRLSLVPLYPQRNVISLCRKVWIFLIKSNNVSGLICLDSLNVCGLCICWKIFTLNVGRSRSWGVKLSSFAANNLRNLFDLFCNYAWHLSSKAE